MDEMKMPYMEDNNKMYLETGWEIVEWIHLAQDWYYWGVLRTR
jgi:hypothetical protein